MAHNYLSLDDIVERNKGKIARYEIEKRKKEEEEFKKSPLCAKYVLRCNEWIR